MASLYTAIYFSVMYGCMALQEAGITWSVSGASGPLSADQHRAQNRHIRGRLSQTHRQGGPVRVPR